MTKWTKRRGLENTKKIFSPSFWLAALWENDSSGLGEGGLAIPVLEVSLAPEQALGAGTGGCFSLACVIWKVRPHEHQGPFWLKYVNCCSFSCLNREIGWCNLCPCVPISLSDPDVFPLVVTPLGVAFG